MVTIEKSLAGINSLITLQLENMDDGNKAVKGG
jgi:hypothetical protein